jgi:hypothetical protein
MKNQTALTESFVVVMIDEARMSVYSSPCWDCPAGKVADQIAEAIAHGYGTFGHAEVRIKILPLAR